MLELSKCKLCKRTFANGIGNICPKCQQLLDEEFVIARDYIYDNPHQTNIKELVEETKIPEKHVLHLIDEGRLLFSGSIEGLSNGPCQVCGKPTDGGTICKSCHASLSKQLPGMQATEKQTSNTGSDADYGKNRIGMHIDHKGKR